MKLLSTLLVFLLLPGCMKAVNLTVKNPEELTYAVSVVKQDKGGVENIELGNIEPKGTKEGKFQIKAGGDFEVRASIPNSALVYQEKRTVTRSDPDPISYIATISPEGRKLSDFNLDAIKKELMDIGPGYGFDALSLRKALQAFFGAVIVASLPKKGTERAIIHCLITPKDLKNAVKYEDWKWPVTSKDWESAVTANNALQLTANIPLYANFTIGTGGDSIYKFKSILTGFGKEYNENGFDSTRLSARQKKELSNALLDYPGSELMYINAMWVIKSGYTEIYKGTKLSFNAKADASTFLTVNGAYKFSSESSDKQQYDETALTFWGLKLSPSVLKEEVVIPAASPEHKEVPVGPVKSVVQDLK